MPSKDVKTNFRDNDLEALSDSLLTTLCKACRNYNGNVGYTPMSILVVPFARENFWKLFGNIVPKNFNRQSDSIKFKISVDEMNAVLGHCCEKYQKPNSTTQVRVFGFFNAHFYEFTAVSNSIINNARYFS